MAATKAPKGDQKYDNTNRGVLFENDKQGNDARPDLTGEATLDIDGFADLPRNEDGTVTIRLAAWSKESKAGQPFFSITFSAPRAK